MRTPRTTTRGPAAAVARALTRLAAIIAVTVAVSLPLGYFALSYQREAGSLETEAELTAILLSQVITLSPDLWQFQEHRLEDVLATSPAREHPDLRRIVDLHGRVILERSEGIRPPVVVRGTDLLDAGVRVGRVEIGHSLFPVLLRTGAVAAFGLVLGAAVFLVLRILPLRALTQRTRQLEAVRAVSEEITRELDLGAVLDLITRRAVDLVGSSSAMLRLWDEATGLLVPKSWVGEVGQRGAISLRPGEGVAGAAAQQRQGLLVNDFRHSSFATPRLLGLTAHTAVLAEPLLYRDRLVGVINLNRNRSGEPFGDEDRRILALFASQAAIAIENARLYEATQKELTERIRAEGELARSEGAARRLAQENAAMAELGRIISSTPNIQDAYESFAAEVRKILPFDRIVISSIDVEKGTVRNLYIAGEGLQGRNTADITPLKGSGHAEVVRTRRSFLLQTDDFQAFADQFPALLSTFQAGFRSILNVPLFAKGEIIGDLLLRSRQLKAYTDRDVHLAERIGAQIAGAVSSAQLYLENVRLYEAAQRELAERRQAERALATRTRHLEAIRGISEEITRELNLETVLDLVIHRAVELVGAVSGSIRLWDPAQEVLLPMVRTGSGTHSATLPLRLGEGVAGAAAAERRGLIVNDFRTSGYAIPALLQGTTQAAVMAAPLLYGEHLVGVLTITRDEADPPFTSADLEVVNLFAPQAAIAIENARLHEAVRHQAARLEARVQERTAELEAALRVKAQFLAVMSHELRTPLNAVLGFSEILLGRGPGDLTPKQERYLRQINGSGRRLLELVTDILTISEIDTSAIRLSPEAIPLASLIQETLAAVGEAAESKRLTITALLAPDLPPAVADRTQLARVLVKLLHNAVKFTPEGGAIRVTARQVSGEERGGAGAQRGTGAEARGRRGAEVQEREGAGERGSGGETSPQPCVEIAVEDTGIGLAPEDLERIFSPFQQVDSSTARAQGGAGVGLSLVRALVGLQGGKVWAESAGLGAGARFIVRLPQPPGIQSAGPELQT